jgi:hypothetical protein
MVEVWISSSYGMKEWRVAGVESKFIHHPVVMALLKKPKILFPRVKNS